MLKFKYFAFTAMVVTLLFSCNDNSNYMIESNPDEFAVLPVALSVPAEGGQFELNITGHEAWTVELTNSNSKAEGWCTLSQQNGEGPAKITVTVQPSNSFVKNRTILINVSNDKCTLKSKVIQATQVLGEKEVLINGLVWSTVNIDDPGTFVDFPDDIGKLYQFNRKIGYNPSPNESPENWPKDYINDNTDWQEANDPSPEGWRLPTTAEMVALWEIGATWAPKSQTGFKVDGMIVGIPSSVAKTANKNNLKQLGGIFLPKCGWRSEAGMMDRQWLVAVRSASQLSGTHGGMSLGDPGGYRDVWGWGDGQKPRAGMLRPVKKLKVEE
jgi:hypothetical protein